MSNPSRNTLMRLALLFGWLAASALASAQSLSGYRPDPNAAVRAHAWQADGRLLVGGDFTVIDGQPAQRMARLRADGSLDPSFSAAIVGGPVSAIVVEPDGRIVIGGTFTHVGPSARAGLARLSSTGALDPTFNPGANAFIHSIVRQVDGKLVVGGNFTQIAGQARTGLARLLPNGSIDASYTTDTNALVFALQLQPDGRLLVGGNFTSVGGIARNRIARLSTTGEVEATFNPNADGAVQDFAVAPDGLIHVAGEFTRVAGQARNRYARLNANGSLNSTSRDIDASVSVVDLQSDGKLLLGGAFTAIDGQPRKHVARLNANGSLDATFAPQPGNQVTLVDAQSDGRVLIGGGFASFAGQPRSRLARVEREGQLDDTFTITVRDGSIPALAVAPDRSVLLAGDVRNLTSTGNGMQIVARALIDGTLDTSFGPRAGNLAGAIAVGDSSMLVGGAFTSIAGQSCSALARLDAAGTLLPGSGACNVRGGDVSNILPLRDGRFVIAGSFTDVGNATRNNIARIDAQGQLDAGFHPIFFDGVRTLAEQADGRLLVGGGFSLVNNRAPAFLVRLLQNGQTDTSFNATISHPVNAVVVQPDGRILIGGIFTDVNGQHRPGLARLLPDGSPDPGFVPQILGSNIAGLQVQTNGDVIAYGKLTLNDRVERILKFRANGDIDTDFRISANAISSIAQQDDGRLLLAGRFDGTTANPRVHRVDMVDESRETLTLEGNTVIWRRTGALPELMAEPVLELSTNGTTFTPIGKMAWSNGAWRLSGLDTPIGQAILLRANGLVRSGVFNSSTGIVRATARVLRVDRIFRDGFE